MVHRLPRKKPFLHRRLPTSQQQRPIQRMISSWVTMSPDRNRTFSLRCKDPLLPPPVNIETVINKLVNNRRQSFNLV